MDAYQKRKTIRTLSVNLLNPTTANLRNECVVVFSERPNERIKAILTGFGVQLINAEDIRRIDADRFRPLRNFMIGEIENPTLQTVELLAWLIDYKVKGNQPEAEQGDTKWFEQKYFRIAAIAVATLVVIYFLWPKKRCMYWDGIHYQQISCDEGAKSELKVKKLDEDRIKGFEKITRKDTIHYKDIGRIWYMKIDSNPDFFTDSGMHPVDEKRQLKPITKYIIDKYILKKKSDTVSVKY